MAEVNPVKIADGDSLTGGGDVFRLRVRV